MKRFKNSKHLCTPFKCNNFNWFQLIFPFYDHFTYALPFLYFSKLKPKRKSWEIKSPSNWIEKIFQMISIDFNGFKSNFLDSDSSSQENASYVIMRSPIYWFILACLKNYWKHWKNLNLLIFDILYKIW